MRRAHNRNHKDFIIINTHLCKACWKCVQACEKNVIGKVDFFFHKHSIVRNSEYCVGCRKCMKVCSENAIFAYNRKTNDV
jgi:2-oxoglutarate ferredoxin oxidoreductase subunit delta